MFGVRSSAGDELHFRLPKKLCLFGRESGSSTGQEDHQRCARIRRGTDLRPPPGGRSSIAREHELEKQQRQGRSDLREPARFRPGPCSYPFDESYSPLRGSQSLSRDLSGCPNLSGADKEVTHCNQYARVSIPEHERSNWLLSTTRFTSNNTERRSSGRSVCTPSMRRSNWGHGN